MMPPEHPSGRASWPSRDDNTLFYLIVIAVGCCVFGYLAWSQWHVEISAGVLAWRRIELRWIGHLPPKQEMLERLAGVNPRRTELADLYQVSRAVSGSVRVPAAVVLLGLA